MVINMYGNFISEELDKIYKITLNNKNEPWRLVLTAILATQVNFDNVAKIEDELFEGKSLEDLANSSFDDIYNIVKHIRFGRVKAERFIKTANILLKDCNGNVPNDPKYLETLPGIGHKNASVIQSMYFDTPSIAVDTHVIRICGRLNITDGTNNVKIVEHAMKDYFDKSCWTRIHQQFMYFGRDICKARNPKCSICPFKQICKFYSEN